MRGSLGITSDHDHMIDQRLSDSRKDRYPVFIVATDTACRVVIGPQLSPVDKHGRITRLRVFPRPPVGVVESAAHEKVVGTFHGEDGGHLLVLFGCPVGVIGMQRGCPAHPSDGGKFRRSVPTAGPSFERGSVPRH